MKELIATNSKIDFMGKRFVCMLLSVVAFAASVYIFVQQGQAKYGTDFLGGHEFLVSFNGDFDSEKIRSGLAAQQLEGVRVQAFQGAKNEYSIRLGEAGDADAVRGKVETALKAAFGDVYTIQKTDYVGPTVVSFARAHCGQWVSVFSACSSISLFDLNLPLVLELLWRSFMTS